MPQVFVALGANLDQPVKQLDAASQALATLAEPDSYRISSYVQSKPMADMDQPDYINAVATFTTALEPLALLDAFQAIEISQGRERHERWGARTLDLDLLLYDELQLQHPRLTIPHYDMQQRAFVLLPLYELQPDLILPDGTQLAALITEAMRQSLHPLQTPV
ncbi:2-amino-4-hydroxy-6-hydroxymethyldihydropteridine diphosphokinase [Shewanella avicenniae]|uniref:2-amino-4-hydroxy-6-hydroxymethyldihydropteridine pyrophosphokinase n=1 Tax=Shewanella avicenniae TaxID=2814294 RepID=A0ABX7QQU2_9GAMM|nr:2-amino-4-hydroxy-6-hydroxymethyldihydropteridine diphosphokinase [Shewanella avicenniae]QSX33080.1 2-amino-4-hydroxy-6-hydroxymethyldihydropteridine diphosphokinase [Shewanella avicenniae]